MAEDDKGETPKQSDKEARKKHLSELRDSMLPDQSEQVKNLVDSLEGTLLLYLNRPNSDSKVVELLMKVVSELDRSLEFGFSGEPLSPNRLMDVKAGLVGASRVLDPSAERFSTVVSSLVTVGLAARFLELVEHRVGTRNPETGESEVRMREEGSNSPTIILRERK